MKIWVQMFFPKNPNALLAYLHRREGGEGDSAEGTPNFKKGTQAGTSPPWGRVSKPLKKGLITPLPFLGWMASVIISFEQNIIFKWIFGFAPPLPWVPNLFGRGGGGQNFSAYSNNLSPK